jgi:hypothetical protein
MFLWEFVIFLSVSEMSRTACLRHVSLPSTYFTSSGPNVIKLFTAVIYHHSLVILSFCVIKPHYHGNYHEMAVNCEL